MVQLPAYGARRRCLGTGILCVLLMMAPVLCHAAALLSESLARSKAIALLKGDPYGQTSQEVARNILEGQLITSGDTKCGGTTTRIPVWQFHVLVPAARNPSGDNEIDGYLLLDARTGKLTCAGLPFMD